MHTQLNIIDSARPADQAPATPPAHRPQCAHLPLAVLGHMPFVRLEVVNGNVQINFWAVEASQDGQQDFVRGERYATDLAAVVREHDAPALFFATVQALFDSNLWTGVEAGFFSGVASHLARQPT